MSFLHERRKNAKELVWFRRWRDAIGIIDIWPWDMDLSSLLLIYSWTWFLNEKLKSIEFREGRIFSYSSVYESFICTIFSNFLPAMHSSPPASHWNITLHSHANELHETAFTDVSFPEFVQYTFYTMKFSSTELMIYYSICSLNILYGKSREFEIFKTSAFMLLF